MANPSWIKFEINLILTWSANFFIIDNPDNNQVPAFALSKTKIYVPVLISSTQDNEELLQQLISGFKRTTARNKYQSKATIQEQNQC